MKYSKYKIVLLVVVLVISQPFITSFFIDSNAIVNSISVLGILLSVVITYNLASDYINRYSRSNQKIIKKNFLLQAELNRIKEASKYNCMFYEHLENEPFSKLSDSVEEIIGVSKEEFKSNLVKYNARELFEGVFDKVKRFEKIGFKNPVYKVKLITNEGERVWLRVHEIPIYDHNNNLEKVWGMAYKTLEKSYVRFLTESEFHAKYDTLLDVTNDAVFLMKNDRFVDCNTKALDMFNVSLNQIILYTPFNYRFSPKTQPNGELSEEEAIKKIKKAYKGQPQTFNWTHSRLNGETFNANVNLKVVTIRGEKHLFATISDNSEVTRIREELEEKDRLTQIAFYESPRPLLKHDKEGVILEVNSSFLTVFKITKKKCLGKKFFEIFDNDDLSSLIEKTERESAPDSIVTEIGQVDSGITFPAFVKALPLFHRKAYDGGILLIEEKTEIKVVKRELNKKEKDLRDILKYSVGVIYKYNINSSDYEYISESVSDLFGYSSKDFTNFSTAEMKSLLHPKEFGRASSLIAKLTPQFVEDKQVNECNIIHKDGRVRRIRDVFYYTRRVDNSDPSIIGFIYDITDQLNIQGELSLNKEILKTIAESQDFGVTIIVNRKIAYVNTYIEKMMACPSSDLIGIESLFVFADEDEKVRLKEEYMSSLSELEKVFEMTYWVKNTLGEYIYLNCTYKKLAGNSDHIYVSTKNITQDLIDEYHQTKSEDLKAVLTKYLKSF